jgi:hypothetical protein
MDCTELRCDLNDLGQDRDLWKSVMNRVSQQLGFHKIFFIKFSSLAERVVYCVNILKMFQTGCNFNFRLF